MRDPHTGNYWSGGGREKRSLRQRLRLAMGENGHAQLDVAHHAKFSQTTVSRFLREETSTLYAKQGVRRYLSHVFKDL